MSKIRNNGTASHVTSQYSHIARDITKITAVYCVWKLLLVAITVSRPGVDYDTSTKILFDQYDSWSTSSSNGLLYSIGLSLTRWDGIYFAANSAQGYVYEQQWAFSWVFTRFSALLVKVSPFAASLPPITQHALVGIVLSLLSHLLAIVTIYFLVLSVLPTPNERKRQIARTTACLHIISPAGVFLIAPFAEASFSLLNMLGMLCYAKATHQHIRGKQDLYYTLAAGFVFGLASTIRSNGLLNGMIFAWDAVGPAFSILFGSRTSQNLTRLMKAILAGLLVAIGFAFPQYIAYQEYCIDLDRPWCKRLLPSIYNWVQTHYWGVGFLQYWTLSNIPLFLLALPVIYLLLNTGYGALHHARSLLMAVNGEERPSLSSSPEYQHARRAYKHILERLALPQLVLALLAFTSFHVQIINRISSAYPVWYLVLAIAIDDQSPRLECGHTRSQHYYPFRTLRGRVPKIVVQGFVMYAVIQAGLFASFLPPA